MCLLFSVFAFACLAIALVLVFAAPRAGKIAPWIALMLSLLPLAIGGAGMWLGRSRVDQALSSGAVDPSVIERIRTEGYSEASQCVVVGGTLSALPLVPAAMLVLFGLARVRRRAA